MKTMTTEVAKKLPTDVRKALYKEFRSWHARITEFSRKKALYELYKPDSERTRICMFRDDHNVYVYGDYGSFDFDKMTWQATPHSLRYDDVTYQFGKMSDRSKQAIKVYDPVMACGDIQDWLKETLDSIPYHEITKYEWSKVKSCLNNPLYPDIDKIIDECPFLGEDAVKIINAGMELMSNAIQGREFLVAKLSEYAYSEIDVDQDMFSLLEDAGMVVHESVWISLFALSILGDKMEHMKKGGSGWHVLYGERT